MINLKQSQFVLCSHLPLLSLVFSLCACAGEKPDALTKKLQLAIDQGNADAALALGDFADAPPDVVSTYIGILENCAHQSHCKVTLGKFEKTSVAKPGLQFAIAPSGVLNIEMTWRNDNSNGGMASLPYALVGKTHQIVYASYTPTELGKWREKSTQQLMDEALSNGFPDLSLATKRTDWKTAAKPLPADGGDIGKRFRERAQAIYAAAKSLDLDAVLRAGGDEEARKYYAFDAEGNALPANVMTLKLRANLPSYPKEIKVLGGLKRTDDDGQQVVLLIEASLPNGWIQRGPVLINIYSDSDQSTWRTIDQTIRHPR
jgi:hypothetical protein